MANNFFTADIHAGHEAILRYCSRPFRDRVHMWESIKRNWNQRVRPSDTVYHVGDFCTYGRAKGEEGDRVRPGEYESQLTGRIIHIRGNHDRNNGLKGGLEYAEILVGKLRFLLTHRPQLPYGWDKWPSVINCVVCGHVHEKWHTMISGGMPFINVGVDVNNFHPVRTDELLNIYRKLVGK